MIDDYLASQLLLKGVYNLKDYLVPFVSLTHNLSFLNRSLSFKIRQTKIPAMKSCYSFEERERTTYFGVEYCLKEEEHLLCCACRLVPG